jgi:hypothetical protein
LAVHENCEPAGMSPESNAPFWDVTVWMVAPSFTS